MTNNNNVSTQRLYNQGYRQLYHTSNLSKYAEIKSSKILIVGLGKGIEVPMFLSKGCSHVDAVEPYPSIEMNKFGSRFTLIKSFAEDIPIENNTYDIVYTIATLEHVADPNKAMKEMLRVLKPNGLLYCRIGPLWCSPFGYHAKPHYPKLHEPWFHLKYSLEEYLDKRVDLKTNTYHQERLKDIYKSKAYNRLSADVYFEIISDLIKNYTPLHISTDLIPEKYLEKFSDEKLENYSKRDLITKLLTIVVRKTK